MLVILHTFQAKNQDPGKAELEGSQCRRCFFFSSTGLEFAFNMLSILAADVLRVSVLGVHPLGSTTGVGIHTNLQI